MANNPKSSIVNRQSSMTLDRLAALMAAELLAGGEYLHVITKKNKHTGTWLKSNLTNAISNLLHEHIELIKHEN